MSLPTKSKGIVLRSTQKEEILKCAKDPIYFINTYCKIRTTEKGTILFKTYPFQNDCIRDFIRHRFNIVLKSRQLGLSTVTAAYSLWKALFRRDQVILAIATKKETARSFLNKVKKMMLGLPEWLKITDSEPVQDELRFGNGSVVKSIPTTEDAGRSETLSLLIVDEAAFIRNFDTIWTAIYPTLSTGGEAIIISTPNGVGGQYYELWTRGEKKENNFNTIKLPWQVHPEHDQFWYEDQVRQLGNKKKVAQELLCEFLSSGDTFLPDETMTQLLGDQVTPSYEGPRNNVWCWKSPDAGKKYLLAGDVARGDAADSSTFQIVEIDSGEIVAEYSGKLRPDKFALLINEYGLKYNKAFVAVESNTFGFQTNLDLVKLGYPHLYYDKMPKNNIWGFTPNEKSKPGFITGKESRIQALNKLEEMLRNCTLRSHSTRLYAEFQTFVWLDDKPQAKKGSHDDLIMSTAIAAWILETYFPRSGGPAVASSRLPFAFAKSTRSVDLGVSPTAGETYQRRYGPVVMMDRTGKIAVRQSDQTPDWLF